MDKTKELEERLRRVEERNERVEADKAWETSKTRKLIIAIFTYLAIGIYLWYIAVPAPFLNAIVPTAGFLLSTLTLPSFKKLWIRRCYKKAN